VTKAYVKLISTILLCNPSTGTCMGILTDLDRHKSMVMLLIIDIYLILIKKTLFTKSYYLEDSR